MNHCHYCKHPYVHRPITQVLQPETIAKIEFGDRSRGLCLDCAVLFLGRPLEEHDYIPQNKPAPIPFCPMPPHIPTAAKMNDFMRRCLVWKKGVRRQTTIEMGVRLSAFSEPLVFDGEYIAIGYQPGAQAWPALILFNKYPFLEQHRPVAINGHIPDFEAGMQVANRLLNEAIRDWMKKNVQLKRWCDSCHDFSVVDGVCEHRPNPTFHGESK
jgi:hypothetical protein